MGSNFPEGTAFCCAAEAMLLGLAPRSLVNSLDLLGTVTDDNVATLSALAEQHNFPRRC